MRKTILALFLCLDMIFVSGCMGLMPKKVELFQDKVKAVPEYYAREVEIHKQAAAELAKYAHETLVSAVAEDASTNVVTPAQATVVLADAVAAAVGPPLKQPTLPPVEMAAKLATAVAKLDARIENFKEDNNENAGKKIEGTGLFQIPYFVWLGGFLVFGFILFVIGTIAWGALKIYSTVNPPLALGMNVASVATRTLGKGLTQVIQGGEKFKEAVGAKFGDDATAKKILQMFAAEHQKAQDGDVKTVVEHLTK